MWEKLIDFNDRFPGTPVTPRGSSLTPGSPLQRHVGWRGERGGAHRGVALSHHLGEAPFLTWRDPLPTPSFQFSGFPAPGARVRAGRAREGLQREANAGGPGPWPASLPGAGAVPYLLEPSAPPGAGGGLLGAPQGGVSRQARGILVRVAQD